MERKITKVLNYNVDLFNFNEAKEFIKDKLDKSEGINPEIIEMASKNYEYSNIIQNAGLIVPDGTGIKLALKLKGINQEKIPGIDIAKSVIGICTEKNLPIALVGAKEQIVEKAVENIKKEYPSLNISYARNGYFNDNEEDEIINRIKESNARFVLIALGAPKQEFFIKKCMAKINNAIFIGVGGAFDVWSGQVQRAPEIYRKLGFEWLYRTIKQPQRIKRIYKTLPLFLIRAIIESRKSV